ncbi:MAG: glycosyltransferase [Bacteroidales bacterium]
MENKIRLSDVIKYLLVGAIFISMFIICYLILFIHDYTHIEFNKLIKYLTDLPSFLIAILILAPSYFAGLFIHASNELLVSLCRRNLAKMEYKLRISEYQNESNLQSIILTIELLFRRILNFILRFTYKYTIEDVCTSMKESTKDRDKYTTDTPIWITLSTNPYKTLKVLAEKISEQDSDIKGEYLYLNEFMLGFRLSIYLISTFLLCGGINNGFSFLIFSEIIAGIIISIVLFSLFAKVFARKYIRYIDSCVTANNISIEDILMQDRGLPCAYILIRSTTNIKHEYFDKMFKSVLQQTYPNIKIILLEDNSNVSETSTLNQYINSIQNNEKVPEIIYCESNTNGAAGSSIAIRNKFVDVANHNDVAILLDDDDELASPTAISTIMSKIITTGANICLVGFKETNKLGLSIINNKNHYDSLLHEISQFNKAIKFNDIQYLCRAASMAWTKCLKKSVVKEYCEVVKDQEEKRNGCALPPFKDLKAYEDFTDYMMFLFNDIRITAITDTVYSYKKHNNSITSNLTKDSFQTQRIGFLHYLIDSILAPKEGLDINDKKINSLVEFLNYKTRVITGILKDKSKDIGYTVEEFWADYKDQQKLISKENNYLEIILNQSHDKIEEFYSQVNDFSNKSLN